MTKEEIQLRIIRIFDNGFTLARNALITESEADFSFIEEIKELVIQRNKIIETARCVSCQQSIIVAHEHYTKVLFSQISEYKEGKPTTKNADTRKGLIYCSVCQDKILKFIDGQTKSGQEEK